MKFHIMSGVVTTFRQLSADLLWRNGGYLPRLRHMHALIKHSISCSYWIFMIIMVIIIYYPVKMSRFF